MIQKILERTIGIFRDSAVQLFTRDNIAMHRVSSLALLLLFLAGCHSASSDITLPAPEQPTHLEVMVVIPRAQLFSTELTGRITPVHMADVGQAGVSLFRTLGRRWFDGGRPQPCNSVSTHKGT
ncbi:hypothetical protein CKO35_08875 [Ectothiorhodospira shaposhnikovii]|nr:hypothetical protein [Ectothiorhodospira shaposhnikovii]